MKHLSDIEVLKIVLTDKDKALKEIYERYSSLVYGVCLKYLSTKEDSLDAVLIIFESLAEKIVKHEINNFNSWLYSVTKNQCLMILRKQKRHSEAFRDYAQEFKNNTNNSNELEEAVIEKLEKAVAMLGEEQKMCIELFYYDQKSYSEISAITGYDNGAVKSYLQNGKIKLKKIMEDLI